MPKQKSIVWNHFSEYLDGKQILHGKCKYCGITYVSNAKRIEIHLTKCNKCPDAIKESYLAAKICDISLLKELSSKKSSQSNLNNLIDKIPIEKKKDKMDKMLARAVYSSCSPFRLVENHYLKRFLKFSSPGYTPPSKDQLSGRLLDEEYQLLKSVMKNKLESANSLTILSDGWTDINHCSIINIVFMAPEPIFYKAIDASAESHTGTVIAGILSTVIEEVGPHKFHALVTDNAKNMKSAWSILKDKYHHLITFGCVAHGLNLLVKDVLSVKEIEEIIDKSKTIIKFFLNHTLLYSVLKDTQRQKTNKVLHLLLPVDTRWGSYNSSLNSLLRIKESLQIATFDKDVLKMITEKMRQDIRNDSYFWPMVQNVHDLIEVPCSVIKCLEGEYPTLLNLSKKLIDMYGDFIEKSYFLEEKSQSYVEDKYLERKDFISHPVHFAAHLLNPQLINCPLVETDKIEAVDFIE
ncbi:uncharacterized protein LOC123267761 [Cotesia glomerata]|uniref:uncharacterized protein LOC123267761 n=1 Tax=Cotesia glomerata TaxID=32391 RepID=UPI001D018A56|nr:uncharacterized protein LOC123267761 [Cotesia glomerata]